MVKVLIDFVCEIVTYLNRKETSFAYSQTKDTSNFGQIVILKWFLSNIISIFT